MRRCLVSFITCACLCAGQSRPAPAPPPPAFGTTAQLKGNALSNLNDAIEDVIGKVAPSVVQILVTGYGPQPASDRQNTITIGRQKAIGSGFVIDSQGYILTNAHVVNGSERIQVVLPAKAPPAAKTAALVDREEVTKQRITTALSPKMVIVTARVIGVARDLDIALLKIEGDAPPPLPLASYRDLRPGEMVFAFGSPEGLRNTVTHGIVSSVARQADPDSPEISIQTDTPINPGNSGGPLVNIRGEVVGMDTFILSKSGGNEGLGFAIPSATLRVAYRQLKQFGRLRRQEIGVSIQTITPEMGAGLKLAQDYGVIISDVLPRGPAEKAGIKAGDILLSVDNQPCDNLPTVSYYFLLRDSGEKVQIEVLRGKERLNFAVPVSEEKREIDGVLALATPEKNMVPELGILGVEIDKNVSPLLPDLRHTYGVITAAKTSGAPRDLPLLPGDVIIALNDLPVLTIDGLRKSLKELHPPDSVVLQIEREGKMMYVAFALE
jgi:serine protease Do